MEYQNIIVNMLQGLGILAICITIIDFAWRRSEKEELHQFFIGFVLSAGLASTMLLPFRAADGLVFDLRFAFLALAAPFGGLPALSMTFFTGSVLRGMEGGVGMTAGLIGIVIASLFSYVFMIYFKNQVLDFKRIAILGLGGIVPISCIVILPLEVIKFILAEAFLHTVITGFFGIVFAASQLSTFKRRLAKQKEMEIESTTDPLTGLLNRRAFDAVGEYSAERAIASDSNYALFILDIDHFKKINDTFGHVAGDDVIKAVAEILSANVPQYGKVGRFGGEEFVMMVPHIDEAKARAVAERLRYLIQTRKFVLNGISTQVTSSIGFCVVDRPDIEWGQVFQYADKALYKAKGNGRNCVMSATRPPKTAIETCIDALDAGYGISAKMARSV